MKVSVDFEIATIDHSISIRKDLGEYKAIISTLQPPFVSIEYDHVLKSGVPLDNYEGK